MDSSNVVASIQEHDQRHLDLKCAVIVLKVGLNLSLHAAQVVDLSVDTRFDIDTIHVVTENNSLRVENLVFRERKLSLGFFKEQIIHELSIRVIV